MMEWFNGGVGEAIAAAKAQKAIFVVVVKGAMSVLFVIFYKLKYSKESQMKSQLKNLNKS